MVVLMLEPNPRANKSILLIEDDKPTRGVLTTLLQHAGYNVTCAWLRHEVLALVRFHPFDLVVTDGIMPEIDGAEVITAVRRYHPSVPVIAMSGREFYMSGELSLKLAESVGALITLVKPFRLEELLMAVEKALPSRPVDFPSP